MTDSTFIGFSVIGDDVRVDVDISPTGPQPFSVHFVLPDFGNLPNLCLSRDAATQLRDGLTRALLESAYVDAGIATLEDVSS
jgi:hypothetical protein